MGYAIIKKALVDLVAEHIITKKGNGKSTKYTISLNHELILPIDPTSYFKNEIDNRKIKDHFNHTLIGTQLTNSNIFIEQFQFAVNTYF